jgi:hypothetical protein
MGKCFAAVFKYLLIYGGCVKQSFAVSAAKFFGKLRAS